MSNTKVSNQFRSKASPEAAASVSGDASPREAVLGHKSPAMTYWQGVAAAGRAAKPAAEAKERQTPGQRPVAWAKP